MEKPKQLPQTTKDIKKFVKDLPLKKCARL